jgi:hypothetical protein
MKRKIIKGIFAVICILCLSILSGQIVLAHPGGTDENGGHYDHEAGLYHYHHGYPPHSHKDGVCPYDFNDRTGWNSGSSSGSSVKITTNPPVETTIPKKQVSSETTLQSLPASSEQESNKPVNETKRDAGYTALGAIAIGILVCTGIIMLIEFYYIKIKTDHAQWRKEQQKKGK